MKKLLLILPTFCFIISLSAMDDPRYERLSKQAEDYYNRADPSTSSGRTGDEDFQKINAPQELYYEEESSDEDEIDSEEEKELIRQFTKNRKKCSFHCDREDDLCLLLEILMCAGANPQEQGLEISGQLYKKFRAKEQELIRHRKLGDFEEKEGGLS